MFLKIMSIETKDEHFCAPFLFILIMHSIFMKKVITFGHGSLSVILFIAHARVGLLMRD
jgi:hypothetical protein